MLASGKTRSNYKQDRRRSYKSDLTPDPRGRNFQGHRRRRKEGKSERLRRRGQPTRGAEKTLFFFLRGLPPTATFRPSPPPLFPPHLIWADSEQAINRTFMPPNPRSLSCPCFFAEKRLSAAVLIRDDGRTFAKRNEMQRTTLSKEPGGKAPPSCLKRAGDMV